MRRVMLSHPLPVDGLVSHYLTNNLIGRSPLPWRPKPLIPKDHIEYYSGFPRAILDLRVRGNVFLARPPHYTPPKGLEPFDLHVLAMPPAFNLSQDQTLQLKFDVSDNQGKPRSPVNY